MTLRQKGMEGELVSTENHQLRERLKKGEKRGKVGNKRGERREEGVVKLKY